MKEQTIQANILKYLESIGAYSVKIISASRKGVPDITGCLPGGRFFAIEVKLGNAKATPLQQYNIDLIHSAGGIAFVANNVNTVKEKLKCGY